MTLTALNIFPASMKADDPIVSGFKEMVEEVARKAGGKVISIKIDKGDATIEVDEAAHHAVEHILQQMATVRNLFMKGGLM